VLPVIVRCTQEAQTAARIDGDPELERLGQRFGTLAAFVQQFDHGVEIFVRGDARAIEDLFGVLGRLDGATVDRLWKLVDELGADDLHRALVTLSSLPPAAARRLVSLADQPVLKKLIGVS
jgi:hypothetical protein